MINSGSLALKFLVVIFSQTVSKKKKKKKTQKTDSDFFPFGVRFPHPFFLFLFWEHIPGKSVLFQH